MFKHLFGNVEHFRSEISALSRLAGPLILTSIVSMGLAITDVIMMNWLGAAELGAGAATSDYYSIIFYLIGGVVAAMSPMISQARGANNPAEVREYTHHGFILALTISIPGAFIVWYSPGMLALIGVDNTVVELAYGYAQMMSITFVFMICSVACHDFLAAHERTKVILYISAIGLPVNALGNYLFMFGNGGMPAMGLAGAGLASAVVSGLMLASYIAYIVSHKDFKHYKLISGSWQLNRARFQELFRIGLPIGISTTGELGVYLLSTVVIGVFGVEALAAHALTLRLAGVLYAVPLGMSQATTVRTGLAVGAKNEQAFKTTAATALIIALSVGFIYLVTLFLIRDSLALNFFNGQDAQIAVLAITLLGILAIIQPFECIATVSNGILRGLKDTKIPMFISIGAFWIFGFAGGWSLAFYYNFQATGIWIGLLAASLAYCIALVARFRISTRLYLAQT